jgi:hypothetical protein
VRLPPVASAVANAGIVALNDIEAARCSLPGFSEVSAKVLNSTEDAHTEGMSTFETDERLQVCRSAAPVACEPPPVACGPVAGGGGGGGLSGPGGSVLAVSFVGSRCSLGHDAPNRQQIDRKKFIGQSSDWNTTLAPCVTPTLGCRHIFNRNRIGAFLPSEGAAPYVIHPNSRAFAFAACHA